MTALSVISRTSRLGSIPVSSRTDATCDASPDCCNCRAERLTITVIGLPPADAIFAGGGDHAVLATAIRLASPRTVVVTLAAVQRVGETATLLAGQGYRADGVQLQASRLKPLPGGNHRLAAQNPVFVLWGHR